jgi:hypothetical protein
MKASSAVAVLLAALASAGAQAQNADVAGPRELADRWLYGMRWMGRLAAQGHALSNACRLGDPEVWKRGVATYDRIYQRCVPAQSAVARIVESKYAIELLKTTNGSKRAVTALVFERELARASDTLNKTDWAQGCADPKVRRWLESGYVDRADNWEWFDRTLPYKMGTDPALAEQPCGNFAAQEDPK